MKVSYRWLQELAPGLGPYTPEVDETLAMRGFPVEEAIPLGAGLGDIVVGHVLEVRSHPNADRLRICTVEAGTGLLQVVCGAPNVEAGGWYPFAPVGATLPGGMRIGEAKLRGELSQGMLCSEKELGLGVGKDGLMVLAGPFRPGEPLVGALGLDDVRLDVEVTSNRPDLLSHLGVAREIAPKGDRELRLPAFPGEKAKDRKAIEGLELRSDPREATGGPAGLSVRVEAPDLCPRYLGLVVRGIHVGPSPGWLQARLRAVGSRPINNVVDATNYVLLELGQPLHAFDLAKLRGGAIVVRRARGGEPIETLDGVKRSLFAEMLAICDRERPVAVAGVMGGANSEVTDATTDVLLECALFRPGSIRATRKALGPATDASYRFERGVDPEGMVRALHRAARLIVATAGGSAEGPILEAVPTPFERPRIALRPERVGRLLGTEVPKKEIRAALTPLGFEVSGKGSLEVAVPGFRSWDVRREVDLIEEIARVRGYDRFPEESRPFRPSSVPDHPLFALEDRIRDELVGWGLLEAQTPAFASEGEVELLNPLSSEERFLRSRLLPGLLRRLEYNAARGNRDVRLFELGTVFAKAAAGGAGAGAQAVAPGGGGAGRAPLPAESTRLAVVLHGGRAPIHWSGSAGELDAWDLKALLERIVRIHGAEGWALRSGGDAGDGRATVAVPEAALRGDLFEGPVHTVLDREGRPVGIGGVVRPGALDLPPWAGTVLAAEVALPARPAPVAPRPFEPIPAFPGVERDLALLVPGGVRVDRVLELARARAGEHVAEVGVFDVYRDGTMRAGERSVAIRLRFRAPDRTLTDAEVDGAIGGVVRALQEEVGVGIRGRTS